MFIRKIVRFSYTFLVFLKASKKADWGEIGE